MKNKKNFIIDFLYYLAMITIVLTITYITVKWLLPFVLSLLIVMILQPIISHIQQLCKIKNKFFRAIIAILFYSMILSLILYLLFIGMIQLYLLLVNLPTYLDYINQLLVSSQILVKFAPYFEMLYASINEVIQSATSSFINYLLTFIAGLPSFLFDAMFVIISSLFFIVDYAQIKHLVLRFSGKKEKYLVAIVGCIKDTLSSLFKAYFIIFIVTFIELLVGCYIIDISDALMIAFAIAIFDFLPVLGLDMIMIPWIVIEAVCNHMQVALGLLILYMVIVITKNILEPKLISAKIGMHPLATILGMFLGAKMMGVIGMIVFPIAIVIGKRIYTLNKEYTDG